MATQAEIESREQRGLEIAQMGKQIRRIDGQTYYVRSQSGNGEYRVSKGQDGWNCECPGHKYRRIECKHIFSVEISLSLRAEIKVCVGSFSECHPTKSNREINPTQR